jgi:AcrR family transcriptional regulator
MRGVDLTPVIASPLTDRVVAFGVLRAGPVIGGTVVSSGRVPNPRSIIEMLVDDHALGGPPRALGRLLVRQEKAATEGTGARLRDDEAEESMDEDPLKDDRLGRRERLLQVAIRHLETRSAASLRVSEIATEAGVAVGLIKHYFGSRDGLVSAAQQQRIIGSTAQDIAGARDALVGAADLEALMEGIRRVARLTIDRRRSAVRLSRFAAIATAHGRPEVRVAIGSTLSELIDEMAELIADAQARGIVRSRRSPRALATFIQAYSLGLLIHDLDPAPCDDEELLDIAMDAIREVFSRG